MCAQSKRVTIKDVARLAKVSKGTVDRVIHNRGEVSEESRAKVIEVIEQLGYKPNMYASLLASKREYKIVALIPEFAQGEFWELMQRGTTKAAQEYATFNVDIQTLCFDQFSLNSFEHATARLLDNLPDAVLIAPSFKSLTSQFVTQLRTKGIPFAYVDSKIDDSDYLSFFGMPLFESGYLGADLLVGRQKPQEVACFRIHRPEDTANTTAIRREGFFAYMREFHPQCKIYSQFLQPYDPVSNEQILNLFFEKHPGVQCLITFNSRAFILADYLKKKGFVDKVLVGYDMLESNMARLKEGVITYLITQRIENQGYEGIKSLCDKLLFHKDPPSLNNYMSMDILTRYNVGYY